ncbi:MAG TPA: hypothetical protein VE964_15070 [Myxococcales bacterium]|nr:hypothetical protein [Myxococcales bacterium]
MKEIRVKRIATAGNTVVPALLVLERLGFKVIVEQGSQSPQVRASRGDEEYIACDPVTVLGLVKLIEARTWDWKPTDAEIATAFQRYHFA